MEEPREALNDAIVCSRLRLLGINRVWDPDQRFNFGTFYTRCAYSTKVPLRYTRNDLEMPCPDMLPKLGGDFVNKHKMPETSVLLGKLAPLNPCLQTSPSKGGNRTTGGIVERVFRRHRETWTPKPNPNITRHMLYCGKVSATSSLDQSQRSIESLPPELGSLDPVARAVEPPNPS